MTTPDARALYREGQADLAAGKTEDGNQKLDRVALTLESLTERFAAEVLTEIGSPTERNDIMARIRKP